MKRGEIWSVSGGNDYAGKPRPVVILQDDNFDATLSITVCAFTTDDTDAPLMRLQIEPSSSNGLRQSSRIMVDKIITIPKTKMGKRIGQLENAEILRLNQAVFVFLGLADTAKRRSRK